MQEKVTSPRMQVPFVSSLMQDELAPSNYMLNLHLEGGPNYIHKAGDVNKSLPSP
jgi:hypothetical protein